MTVQIPFNFSFSKQGMRVREFVTSDREVVSFFENIDDVSKVEKFEQVLRMGVMAVKSTGVTDKIDYIEKEFSSFDSRTKDRFTEFFRKIEDVFGEHGSVFALLKENGGENTNTVKDLFDRAIDPFKNEIMKEIANIKEQIGINNEVGKLRQTTTLKGSVFQDYCENILDKIARTHADILEVAYNKTGKITNCKVGDYVMVLGNSGKKLVFEIKDVNDISMPDINKELEYAKKNREADYAIFVVRDFEALPKSVGWFNEYNGNGLVCALGKKENDVILHEELLYIAYKWAKWKVILESIKENKIDSTTLIEKCGALKCKFKAFQRVLTQCGNIEKATEDIRRIIGDAGKGINEDLDALINAVKPSD